MGIERPYTPAGFTEEEWQRRVQTFKLLERPKRAPQPSFADELGVPIPDAPKVKERRLDIWTGGHKEVEIANMTYVVRCGDFVKIGITKDIRQRLASLELHNPHELRVIALVAGGRPVERELHSRFASCRHKGEWFRIEGELAEWIDDGCPVESADG